MKVLYWISLVIWITWAMFFAVSAGVGHQVCLGRLDCVCASFACMCTCLWFIYGWDE